MSKTKKHHNSEFTRNMERTPLIAVLSEQAGCWLAEQQLHAASVSSPRGHVEHWASRWVTHIHTHARLDQHTHTLPVSCLRLPETRRDKESS